jgi:hypothetical protein
MRRNASVGFASSGHPVASTLGRYVPILLQKSVDVGREP